jgi:hypothetical protein
LISFMKSFSGSSSEVAVFYMTKDLLQEAHL